jgi:hypothetical protein
MEPGVALGHLQALGSVRVCENGHKVRLVSHVLLATMGKKFLVAPMLNQIRKFAETVEHNVCNTPGPFDGRMQRSAQSTTLDPEQVTEVQRFVRLSGQAFLDGVDEKLASCSLSGGHKGGLTYGVGVYVFVDRTAKRREGS